MFDALFFFAPRSRPVALRHFLARLFGIALAPLLLLAAWHTWQDARAVQQGLDERAVRQATSAAIGVDRALRSRIRGLEMMAASALLDEPQRLAEAYDLARGFLQAYEAHVLLARTDGQMVFNTRVPLGTALPPLPRPAGRSAAADAVATGKPAVGDVFMGPVAGVPLVAIAVPVVRDGQVRALLLTTLDAERFLPELDALRLQPGWTLRLRDSQGTLIAEGQAHARAPRATGATRTASTATSAATVANVASAPAAAGAHRASVALGRAPWTAEVEIDGEAYAQPMRAAGVTLAGALLLATATGLFAAGAASRRLERSVSALAEPAGDADTRDGPAHGIEEVERVRARLRAAEQARAQALQELAMNQSRYRSLFENSPDMIVLASEDGRIHDVNAAACRGFRLSREALLARRREALIDPADDRLQTLLQARARDGTARGELTLVRADGERFPAEVTTTLHTGPDGAPQSSNIIRDISDRVAAEARLRQREREFRSLAEQLPAVVYRARCDEAHTIDYVSPQVADWGYTPEQWTADPAVQWLCIHPDDLLRVRAERAAARVADTRTLHLEYRCRSAGGGWRQVTDHSQVIVPADGSAPFVLGVAVDATATRRAELAVREAETYQRTLFEALAEGVLLLDAEHRVLAANPAAHATLGYGRDDLIGLSIHTFLKEGDRAAAAARIEGLIAEPAPRLLEWTIVRRDGSGFPAELSARPVGDRRYVLVLRNITERYAVQEALRTYQGELSELTRRLLEQERQTSHHIAQTLHDHLGQSLAVARLHLDAALVRMGSHMPDGLHAECERLSQTIDQAIRDVRLVLGRLRPPMLEEQGLVAALDNEIRARSIDRGHVDVLLEIDSDSLALRWPATVEYAAFMIAREAIVNAQRHAQASLVRVVVAGDAQRLVLEVVDDGTGIAEELRAGRPGHLGLVGMRERAAAIGARVDITPLAMGGTRVSLYWTQEANA